MLFAMCLIKHECVCAHTCASVCACVCARVLVCVCTCTCASVCVYGTTRAAGATEKADKNNA